MRGHRKVAFALLTFMKTNVYVDAFNLYYGSLKGTSYKWLDLRSLSEALLPQDQIHRIRYFTALINARLNDPQAPQRQQTYIRALNTLQNLTVHYGHFLSNQVRMPLVKPTSSGQKFVLVFKTEEKDPTSILHLIC